MTTSKKAGAKALANRRTASPKRGGEKTVQIFGTDTLNRKGYEVSFLDAPPRMNELWNWVVAIAAYDFADPDPLAGLISSEGGIPVEFRSAIAEIVRGRRVPNRKAAAKLKVPAAERMKIAGSVGIIIGMCHMLKFQASAEEGLRPGAVTLGARYGREPIDITRELEGEARRAVESAATHFGVSTETIENLLRDMKARIARWPAV